MDDLDFIMAWESGEITTLDEVVAGFQSLINSGLAWKLQGSYGIHAAKLIEAGLCYEPGKKHENEEKDHQTPGAGNDPATLGC